MSKPIVLAALLCAAAPVACMPGASLDKDQLVKTASFDHGCPPEKIRLVSEDDGGMNGTGRYVVDVCGTQRRYKRAGTMYYDADKGLAIDGKRVD